MIPRVSVFGFPSPQLQGCACSNVVGLLGAVLSFCLYCYGLSILPKKPCANFHFAKYSRFIYYGCPEEVLVVSIYLLFHSSYYL